MNKKFFLLLLLSLTITNTLSAQYKSVLLGFRGGFGLSGVSMQNKQIYGRYWGFSPSWSFFCDYYFVENYAISAVFSSDYLKTSYITNESSSSTNLVKRSINTNFLDFSVLMKLKTEDFGRFNAYADIGGGLGVRSSSQVTSDGVALNSDDMLKKARASFTIGTGASYSLRYSTSVALGIYYKTGTRVIKELADGKINTISILATFKF